MDIYDRYAPLDIEIRIIEDRGCSCPACMADIRRASINPGAVAKAESLLLSHLNPQQTADWLARKAFNVRGSRGSLFRLDATRIGSHASCMTVMNRRSERFRLRYYGDYYGTAVWPIGLDIPADWALGLYLYVKQDEERVLESGCHEWLLNNGSITDYNGLI